MTEPIGERLRNARTARGVSIEQAARDTHVAKRYLEALEDELFETFPAEAYVLGFLRAYGRYLNLDEEQLIHAYRNVQLQDEPAPIKELLKPRRSMPRWLPIVAVAVVVAGGIGALFALDVIDVGAIAARVDARRSERVADREATRVARAEEAEAARAASTDGSADPAEPEADDPAVPETPAAAQDPPPAAQDPPAGGDTDAPAPPAGDSPDTDTDVAQQAAPAAPSTTTIIAARRLDPIDLGIAPDGRIAGSVTTSGTTLVRVQIDTAPPVERVVDDGDAIPIAASERARVWVGNAGLATLVVGGRSVPLGAIGTVAARELALVGGSPPRVELRPLY